MVYLLGELITTRYNRAVAGFFKGISPIENSKNDKSKNQDSDRSDEKESNLLQDNEIK